MLDDERRANLANWESRVPIHTGPAGYDLDGFDDPAHLSDVVRFDLPRLGRLAGLDLVHLQCHIGTDTVSLGRLGARTVVGYDFSAGALDAARALADRAGAAHVSFVEGELYDAVERLGRGRFDLVYTGIGALCWLPDIRGWARVVAGLLRPGGRLFLREGHPMLWAMADDAVDGSPVLAYPYFEMPTPTRFEQPVTYAGDGRALDSPETYEWNHGLGEIVTALLDAGMRLTALEEHQSVPWEAIEGAMVRGDLGEWRLADRPERLAASYTLQAVLDR